MIRILIFILFSFGANAQAVMILSVTDCAFIGDPCSTGSCVVGRTIDSDCNCTGGTSLSAGSISTNLSTITNSCGSPTVVTVSGFTASNNPTFTFTFLFSSTGTICTQTSNVANIAYITDDGGQVFVRCTVTWDTGCTRNTSTAVMNAI